MQGVSCPGIHCDSDRDWALTEDEWMIAPLKILNTFRSRNEITLCSTFRVIKSPSACACSLSRGQNPPHSKCLSTSCPSRPQIITFTASTSSSHYKHTNPENEVTTKSTSTASQINTQSICKYAARPREPKRITYFSVWSAGPRAQLMTFNETCWADRPRVWETSRFRERREIPTGLWRDYTLYPASKSSALCSDGSAGLP